MTAIHPTIIVHWTRPQITNDRGSPLRWDPTASLTAADRLGYVKRLRSIYCRGLRFSVPTKRDVIYGCDDAEYSVPMSPLGMICFTEVGLDRVVAHGGKYGRLGIGFHRDWLLARGANPVLYLQSARQGIVNTNMSVFTEVDRLLETHPLLRRTLLQFLTYVKPMSELGDTSLRHYDDMEWRVVAATMTVPGKAKEIPVFKQRRDGFYLPFAPSDVRLIVAPDESTRRMLLQDRILRGCFESHLPMMIDFTEIGQL